MRQNNTPVQAQLWLYKDQALSNEKQSRLSAAHKERCLACLSDDEQARYTRFRDINEQQRYLAARALLRFGLNSLHPEISPSEWVIHIDDLGKPHIDQGTAKHERPLHFNLSHTSGLAVLLTSSSPCGVDAEYLGRPLDYQSLSRRYFSVVEQEAISKQSPRNSKEQFLRFWTLKEAYLKAQGMGLRVELKRLGFEIPDSACAYPDKADSHTGLRSDPQIQLPSQIQSADKTNNQHEFQQLKIANDHLVSIAVETQNSGFDLIVHTLHEPDESDGKLFRIKT